MLSDLPGAQGPVRRFPPTIRRCDCFGSQKALCLIRHGKYLATICSYAERGGPLDVVLCVGDCLNMFYTCVTHHLNI